MRDPHKSSLSSAFPNSARQRSALVTPYRVETTFYTLQRFTTTQQQKNFRQKKSRGDVGEKTPRGEKRRISCWGTGAT